MAFKFQGYIKKINIRVDSENGFIGVVEFTPRFPYKKESKGLEETEIIIAYEMTSINNSKYVEVNKMLTTDRETIINFLDRHKDDLLTIIVNDDCRTINSVEFKNYD